MTTIDFVLCEIGGTVGDIEAMPFPSRRSANSANELAGGEVRSTVHLTLMPWIPAAGELKTSRRSIRSRNCARSALRRTSFWCVPTGRSRWRSGASCRCSAMCAISAVIQAPDVAHIYDVPMAYHGEGLDSEVWQPSASIRRPSRAWSAGKGGSRTASTIRKARWRSPSSASTRASRTPTSRLMEALGAWRDRQSRARALRVDRIGDLREGRSRTLARKVHGILVPGGFFGERGSEGKILAAKFRAGNARCHISASASVCRWPGSRRRVALADIEKASPRRNSAQRTSAVVG